MAEKFRHRAHRLSRRRQDDAEIAFSPRIMAKRFAVIVNEFGQIGIDNDLVVGADEEVFEMNNGCICCAVRGDLIRIIEGLLKRRASSTRSLSRRLASPIPPPWRKLLRRCRCTRSARLDAVVTIADAKCLQSG